jgi:hypothetical protein
MLYPVVVSQIAAIGQYLPHLSVRFGEEAFLDRTPAFGRLRPDITLITGAPSFAVAEHLLKIAEHFTFLRAIKNPVDH